MKESPEVLVLDDDSEHLKLCRDILHNYGYESYATVDPPEALAYVGNHSVHVVVVDLKMPAMSGVEVLREIQQLNPGLPVIMLTAFPTTAITVESIKIGAFDFLEKPISAPLFIARIKKALDYRSVYQDLGGNGKTPSSINAEDLGYLNLVGRSQAMQKVYETIKKLRSHDINIFIHGASGTGKELTAEAIYRSSNRASGPFVPIDCTALSGSLIESELFGHEKGAFTGAISTKKGLLESAHGGTVFLDEISEIHPELQARFLRVLERGHIRRVGGQDLIDLDIQFISATNRNPWDAIRKNQLREDLFHRLNGITLNLPSLKDRDGDIELLCRYFLEKIADSTRSSIKKVDDQAMEILENYHWPGNVRELSKLMEQLHILVTDETITPTDLPPYVLGNGHSEIENFNCAGKYKVVERKWLHECRRNYFNKLLDKHDNNISAVAKEAGIDRTSIYRWMKDSSV